MNIPNMQEIKETLEGIFILFSDEPSFAAHHCFGYIDALYDLGVIDGFERFDLMSQIHKLYQESQKKVNQEMK